MKYKTELILRCFKNKQKNRKLILLTFPLTLNTTQCTSQNTGKTPVEKSICKILINAYQYLKFILMQYIVREKDRKLKINTTNASEP